MSEKRKDSKGRILKTGESQRKDGLYQYRYKGVDGKRKTIYDPDLRSLRRRAAEIQASLLHNTDFTAGNMTMQQLTEKYLNIHRGLKYSTLRNYEAITKFLKTQSIYSENVNNITSTMVKEWIVDMHDRGRKYNTISQMIAVLNPAFQMACDEDILRKNPFGFKLSTVIPKDVKKNIALTYEQQKELIAYASNHKVHKKNLDIFLVMLGTGLRQGEMAGLTVDDLDFNNRIIHVRRQMRFYVSRGLYLAEPKTKAGIRDIPMTDTVYMALKRMVAKRDKVYKGYDVDGVDGFILLSRNGRPKKPDDICRIIKQLSNGYRNTYPDKDMPPLHSHILRHTFCTNMAHAGMDVKTLQYIMGHSDVSTTLSVYSHVNFEDVQDKLFSIMNKASA